MLDDATAAEIPQKQEARAEPPRGLIALELVDRWQRHGAPGLLFVSRSDRRAEDLGANIHSLFPECPVMVLPRWDCLPYDWAGPSREIMGRRASVLRRLALPHAAPLVIATPEAILQRVPPRRVWQGATFTLRVGDPHSLPRLRQFLEATGYGLDDLVDQPGEAVLHPPIVDIFPAGALGPVRVEIDDDEIAAIHAYDPATQRSTGELREITLDAASELRLPGLAEAGPSPNPVTETPWLCDRYPKLETLFDYMPEAQLVAEPGVDQRATLWLEQIEDGYRSWARLPQTGGLTHAPAPERLYCTGEEWRRSVGKPQARIAQTAAEHRRIPLFATERNPTRAFHRFIDEQLAADRRVVLAAADDRDLNILSRRTQRMTGRAASRAEAWQAVRDAPPRSFLALRADFEAGFVLPGARIAVVSAADLLGSRARHASPMAMAHHAFATEPMLQIGHPVVHVDHGIGLLRGIETVELPEMPSQDTLRLEYAGGATLMVPIEEIGSVWGYGGAPDAVSLDRLSGENWTRRRAEIEHEIAQTAGALTRLVRQRETAAAPKLVAPTRDYERFAAGFPFVPTADQAQAVEEVLRDLASGHPMDRLLCGEVGFGKTEIALRAAAVTVLSGRQAAIVAPTTILARQHFGTFSRRFAGLGIEVALLSRLATPAEARRVREGLRDGSVRIVIGTHAIASKDVHCKELGLLVIDEEQRFGARIKDKLRGFGGGLHVLTMTATPIPRTLLRAMAGLQSLSTLETAPARRLPVRTVLTPFAPSLLREALGYERRRGGQSFVVCPRIDDLEPIAARLREIVPELQLEIVHGKMPAAAIDETILAFAGGRGDILLTTNIIETGLDIPRANTMLVWRPDRFGAAQLHQLRGRVGRGRQRGLAYLLTEPGTKLPAATRERLQMLADLDRPAAGFAISKQDLDRRGAGDILGETQAGHIRLIGLEFYRSLLERALAEIAGGETEPPRAPEVKLDVAAQIPADYIGEPELRIDLYARLARLRDPADIDAFADEIEDRFGPPPPATRNLLDLARIAEMARRLGVVQVDAGSLAIALRFAPVQARRMRARHHGEEFHWHGDRLVDARPGSGGEGGGGEGNGAHIEAVLGLLDRLGNS